MKTLLQAASLIVLLLSSGFGAVAAVGAQSAAPAIDGRWDAVLSRNGVDIPFRLDIKGAGPTLKGVFYDGFSPYDGTTSASFRDGKLTLNIEQYLSTIRATLKDGRLSGMLASQGHGPSAPYRFAATRHVDLPAGKVHAPRIDGSWVIPLETPSSKGERAFRFIVRQRGPEVAAAILRIDGDTGAYSGAYKHGQWVLSHFDGGRPGVITVIPEPDGSLKIEQHAGHPGGAVKPDGGRAPILTAYRADVALAKGLPSPDDFLTHTTARNPDQVFKFAFPDLDGHLVTNDDPRFKGKVVVAVISGTWCPNCHDEAQYLVHLDEKYRSKGLAIVDFDFEEPEQQSSLAREHAFAEKYGVKYTTLLAGAPSEMHQKVPQLNNLDTWPATIFIGRDGKVKAIHAGFASPASGKFYTDLKREFTARIEQLLAAPRT